MTSVCKKCGCKFRRKKSGFGARRKYCQTCRPVLTVSFGPEHGDLLETVAGMLTEQFIGPSSAPRAGLDREEVIEAPSYAEACYQLGALNAVEIVAFGGKVPKDFEIALTKPEIVE